MRNKIPHLRALHLVFAATGALMVQATAMAVDAQDEVVVESVAPTPMMHRSPYSAAEKVISITRHISYADLDLITHAGVQTLQSRIHESAESICAKLGRMDRLAGFDQRQCVKDAVREANAQAQTAIDAAEHRMRTARIDVSS